MAKKRFTPTKGAGFIKSIFVFWYLLFRNVKPYDLVTYFHALRIGFKRGLLDFGFSFKKEKFFGYEVYVTNYIDLNSFFLEAFVVKEYMASIETKKPLIIDCGSNMGVTVLYYKHLFKNSRIIAFEPHKYTYSLLLKNISINKLKDVEAHNVALGERKGIMTLLIPNKSGVGTMTLTPGLIDGSKIVEKQVVETVLLSDYIHETVDLIKMDIEGSESGVIKDLDEKGKLKLVKNIIMEYHNDPAGSNDLGDILTRLKKNGFSYVLQSDRDPPLEFYKSRYYSILIHAYRS